MALRAPRWADMVDSSQEAGGDEDSRHDVTRNLLQDDSYCGEPDPDLESSRRGLSRQLETAIELEPGPKDFAFLLPDAGKRSEDGEAPPPDGSQLNASAPEFVPTLGNSGQLQEFADEACSGLPTVVTSSGPSSASKPKRGPPQTRQKRRQAAASGGGQVPYGKRAKAGASEQVSAASPDVDSAAGQAQPTPRGGGAAASDAPATQPPASEEDWQHREEKRRRALLIVKATPEYSKYAEARHSPDLCGAEAPRTPDASDRAMSKRRWEQEVQHWRAALRQWCEHHDSTG
eukprot:gb/GFBE01045084.1/.p1 GENE.gb/GFBE01045084.1/~~gb/GFBE01045084.1/.p1  ORF type:complete len:289 (+),score=43.26 gb/GFBE01045084.1/:1-867(+)